MVGKYTLCTGSFVAGIIVAFLFSFAMRQENNDIRERLKSTTQELEIIDSLYQIKRNEANTFKEHYKESLNELKSYSMKIDSLNKLQLEVIYAEGNDINEDSIYYQLKFKDFD